MSTKTLEIKITGDSAGARRAIREVRRSLRGLARMAGKMNVGMAGMFSPGSLAKEIEGGVVAPAKAASEQAAKQVAIAGKAATGGLKKTRKLIDKEGVKAKKSALNWFMKFNQGMAAAGRAAGSEHVQQDILKHIGRGLDKQAKALTEKGSKVTEREVKALGRARTRYEALLRKSGLAEVNAMAENNKRLGAMRKRWIANYRKYSARRRALIKKDIKAQQDLRKMTLLHGRALDMDKKMRASNSILQSFSANLRSSMRAQVGWFTSAAILFAIPTAIGAGIRSFGQFEKALKDIGAATGATNTDLKALGDEAKRVSQIAPQSAVELVKMARVLVQAGLETDQVVKSIKAISEVATVSGENLETVAKTFTTAMFAWKMGAEEADSIAQTLVGTLNYSRLTVEDLGTSYNYLASTASLMGLSFRETNSILATFSNLGIRASTAGTGLAQLLTQLTAKTPEAFRDFLGKDLKKFITTLESDSPHKFADMIKLLEERGLTAAKAMRMLEMRAGRAMAAALVAGSEGLVNMYEKIDSAQALTKGFQRAMESTANQLAVMKNKAQVLAVELGTVLKPVFVVLIKLAGVLFKMLTYVARGLETVQAGVVLGAIGVFVLAQRIARATIALKAFNIAAVSTAIITAPTWAVLAGVGGILLGLIGYFKTSTKEAGAFDKVFSGLGNKLKAVDDAATAQEFLNHVTANGEAVYDVAQRAAEDYTATIERLRQSLIDTPDAFRRIDEAILETNRKFGSQLKGLSDEIDTYGKKIKAIREARENMKGRTWFQGPADLVDYGSPVAWMFALPQDPDKALGDAEKKSIDKQKKLEAEREALRAKAKKATKDHYDDLIEIVNKSSSRYFRSILAARKEMESPAFGYINSLKTFKAAMLSAVEDAAKRGDLAGVTAETITAKLSPKVLADIGRATRLADDWKSKIESIRKKAVAQSPLEAFKEKAGKQKADLKEVIDEAERILGALREANGSNNDPISRVFQERLDDAKKLKGVLDDYIVLKERLIQLNSEDRALNLSVKYAKLTKNKKDLLRVELELLKNARESGAIERERRGASSREILAYIQLKNKEIEKQQELIAANDSVFAAMSYGFNKTIEEFRDFSQEMQDLGEELARSLQRAFSDTFFKISTFDGFDKERHKNFWGFMKQVAKDFLDSLYQSFMRTLADMWSKWVTTWVEMTAVKAFRGIGSFLGLPSGGGGGGALIGEGVAVAHQGGYIPRYHSGGLAPDERRAILQTGEGVLSRRGVNALGALNAGRVPDGQSRVTVNKFYIQANDAKSFADMVRRNPGAITSVVNDDLRKNGSVRNSIRGYV